MNTQHTSGLDDSDRLFLDKLCAGEPARSRERWEGILTSLLASPKAELHCHLAGSMRPATLKELAGNVPRDEWKYCEEGFGAPLREHILTGDLESVKRHLEYRTSRGSLADYMVVYGLPKTVLTSGEAIRRVVFEVCEDNCREGVSYLELRFNPWMLTGKLSVREYMREIARGLDLAAAHYPRLETALVLSQVKNYTPDLVDRILDEALEANRDPAVGGRIKGIDSAGNEIGFMMQAHAAMFKRARQAGLGIVCHAGEAFQSLEEGLDAIEQAIALVGARRIGHGLAAGVDPRRLMGRRDGSGARYDRRRVELIAARQAALRRRLRDENILVEVCPSSNIHTGTIRTLAEHPLPVFINDGVPVAICTDNRWISHTRLSWEIARVAKAFNLADDQVASLIKTPFSYKAGEMGSRGA